MHQLMTKLTIAGLACCWMFLAVAGRANPTVSAAEFGAHPNDGSDATPAVRKALARCADIQADALVFEPGRYDFWPDKADEKYLFITNNDEGLRRVAFPLFGNKHFCVDGKGATFIFHGKIIPFVLERTDSVTLKNFSIDWARPFHSEVKVLAVGGGSLEVSVPEEYPYTIDHGILVFLDENKQRMLPGDILAFEPVKKETAFMAKDQPQKIGVRAVEIGPRRLRIDENLVAKAGDVLVMTEQHRLYPAVVLSDARGTTILQVVLHHAGGMGVVAQRSRDITLDRVQVTPSGTRVCSLTADATHFADCSGQITMDHCLFENQMDDATNIHGIYSQVTRKLDARSVEVRLVHPQQWGFDYISPGGRLEMVHASSLVTYGEGSVQAVSRINKEYSVVTFDAAVPEELKVGDVVADVATQPDVRISNCIIGRNRARGILLGSRGKIVIEDNVFHTPGAAILLEGDARYWFEQAGVRDLTVRRNRFENCNFGVWGKAVIEVGAGIAAGERKNSRYNRNVHIEDNIFTVFDPRLIYAYCVDGLVFERNQITPSNAYPLQHQGEKAFVITESDHVTVPDTTASAGRGR